MNQKDIGSKLSDEGLILWLALTQHDISHISEFKIENDKLYCKMHFNKSHSSNWEEVKNWITKLPSYFQIFIENPSLIPNEKILNKLENLIQKIWNGKSLRVCFFFPRSAWSCLVCLCVTLINCRINRESSNTRFITKLYVRTEMTSVILWKAWSVRHFSFPTYKLIL